MAGQDLPGRLGSFFQYVKESSDTLCLEDNSASVAVSFNAVVQAFPCQYLLQRQRLPQPPGDVDQHRLLAFKKISFPFHRGIVFPVPAATVDRAAASLAS